MAGKAIDATQRVGQPVLAGHVPDEVGRPSHDQAAGCSGIHLDVTRREHPVFTGARVADLREFGSGGMLPAGRAEGVFVALGELARVSSVPPRAGQVQSARASEVLFVCTLPGRVRGTRANYGWR